MTDQITLTLPEALAERARRIAKATDQPLEQVILAHLAMLTSPLPADKQAELDALRHLSDDALWTIAREQMPEDAQARAAELMARNNMAVLDDSEADELERLVQRADQLMLRKAEASALLRARGFTFTQQDFRPEHE